MGQNNVTVALYDNASAGSGTRLLPAFTITGDDMTGGILLDVGILAANGVYATVTSAGTFSVMALYDQG